MLFHKLKEKSRCFWKSGGIYPTSQPQFLSHSMIDNNSSNENSVQSCLTLCSPVGYSPPGSSDLEILQTRILEWVAISHSRGSSWPRDWTHVSYIGRWILYHWATREAHPLPRFNNYEHFAVFVSLFVWEYVSVYIVFLNHLNINCWYGQRTNVDWELTHIGLRLTFLTTILDHFSWHTVGLENW